MLRGDSDIVFDGPHFNSYRAEKLNHNVLVKIPAEFEFVVVTRKGEAYENVQQMAGRTFCTHAPPNLATLVLLDQFSNPARQPRLLDTQGWEKIYEGVNSGRCVGAVLPSGIFKKLDSRQDMKVVFRSRAMPNQAISAGPRVSPEDQAKIAAALTAPEAAAPTAKLRAAFKAGDSFALTSNREYAGLTQLLQGEWGYY
jgi:ABC-type phosphate/phosphonate transport system substrate-binding protein